MSFSTVHIVASLNTKFGGPSRSIPGLCDAISRCGADVSLVSQRLRDEQDTDLLVPSNPEINVQFFEAFQHFGMAHTPRYGQRLSTLLSKSSCRLIHSHGIWNQCNYHAAMSARRIQIPIIISTRGMLEPWAFGRNSWKKKPIWWLWQKKALQQATAFCATSSQEAENIRLFGFNRPIVIIPNGIDLPERTITLKKQQGKDRFALFLSRIHPVKGLSELVQAWSRLRPEGWKVIVAGPDENGHKEAVRKKIASLGMQDSFIFMGSVEGEQKEQLFRDASLFILPSFSENFGISIAEALAAGMPVITTKGTPWEGLVTHRCGWWIDIGISPLEEAIRQATTLSDAELAAMGMRGRQYVVSTFGWHEIGLKMVSFYDWVLKGCLPADCTFQLH